MIFKEEFRYKSIFYSLDPALISSSYAKYDYPQFHLSI